MGGNGRRRVDPGAVDTLRADLRGEVVAPGDPSYDQARAVYNAMIDKRPALLARCHDVADVIASVRFGRDNGLDIAVRSGGHNGAGFGTLDDGLVIDLSGMRGGPSRSGRRDGPGRRRDTAR
jgi:FAD/FMN-containing dehydrogenase